MVACPPMTKTPTGNLPPGNGQGVSGYLSLYRAFACELTCLLAWALCLGDVSRSQCDWYTFCTIYWKSDEAELFYAPFYAMSSRVFVDAGRVHASCATGASARKDVLCVTRSPHH